MDGSACTHDRVVKLALAFRESKTLLSAIELDVFTILSDEPLAFDALALRAGIHFRGARDFFDALVSLGMLERDAAGFYGNTREAGRYLDRRQPTYIGGKLEFANSRQFGPWGLLTDALRTGIPQSGSRASENYSAYYADPAVLQSVANGMAGGTLPAARAMAERFPWGDYETLVDIGTTKGCLPVQIALAHPHIGGGGFDLAPMKRLFDEHVREHGLSGRLQFYQGDFFKDSLPTADVLVMGRVLHNWDLPCKMILLSKAFDALPAGGALIVYERLIDDERRSNTAGFMASLNMLVMTSGGFDYSGLDCINWMREVGFGETYVQSLTSDLSMVVAHRP
jgi:hypothetical protein